MSLPLIYILCHIFLIFIETGSAGESSNNYTCYHGDFGHCTCDEYKTSCVLSNSKSKVRFEHIIANAEISIKCFGEPKDINDFLEKVPKVNSHHRLKFTLNYCKQLPYILRRKDIIYDGIIFASEEPSTDFFHCSNGIETLKLHLINSLPGKFFFHLKALKKLDIFLFEPQKEFYVDTFTENLDKLVTLRLEVFSRQPMHITKDFFKHLCSLKELIIKVMIKTNDILELTEDTFAALTALEKLTLSYNELSSLHGNLLLAQQNLTILDLSNNQLKFLPPDLFRQTRLLKELYLNNNHLSNPSNIIECIKPLSYLGKLDLGYNRFKTMFGTDLYDNQTLIAVGEDQVPATSQQLNANLYASNKTGALNFRLIDLYQNKIQFEISWLHTIRTKIPVIINVSNHKRKPVYMLLSSSKKPNADTNELSIAGNWQRCECLFIIDYYERVNCTGKALEAYELSNTQACQWQPAPCPSNCVCYWRYDNYHYNCSGRGISEITHLTPIELLGVQTATLDISRNEFKELPTAPEIKGYADVTQMNASYNQIVDIKPSQLPDNLTVLDLRNNLLQHLNSDFLLRYLQADRSISHLYLSNNPWRCDCETKPLLSFVKTLQTQIPDAEQIHCVSEPSKVFLNLTSADICALPESNLTRVFVSVSAPHIILVIIIAICLKFRRQLRICLYNHKICLRCINQRELDEGKNFDAFISYAHQDADFVNLTLLPALEQGEPSYSVCTHERNWLAGAYIAEQIIESVDQSRRTLIVLSQHFIESDWARMEFRTAHQCSLLEGRTRLLIIKYGEITNNDLLDKELKAYLSINTYLDANDTRFWQKLRYAMPHKRGEARRAGMLETSGKVYVIGQVERNA